MIPFLRTLLFRTGIVVITFALIPLLLISLLMPGLKRNAFLANWSSFMITWLRWTCGVDYVVEGAENIPERNAIILSKHQSSWETFGLQRIFPAQTWVLKQELLRIPIFGWALRAAGAIAIDRSAGKKALMQVITEGKDRLDRGYWVVVFPEGTRTKPGTRGKYNAGGAMLASRTGYPVVPVAHNAGSFWGREWIIRPGTVRVVIGEPMDTADMSAGDINRASEEWIESRMEDLS